VTTPEGTAPRGTVPSGVPADHVPSGTGRFGWIFAAVWLFFLYEPFGAAWRSTAALPWRVVGIAALVLFAVGFIAFSAWWRRLRLMDRPRASMFVWLALAAGAALLVLAAPSGGVATLAGLVYIAVTAVMNLPLRQGGLVVLACVAAVAVLPRMVPGWTPSDGAIGSVLLASFAGYGVSQVLERNTQLARAREQLVDLAVSQERERMGRDVHDILGHSLTVITVKTELAGRLLESVPADPAVDRARAEVTDVERLAREALADVRATVSGTREVSLTGELAAARSALAAAGIRADLPGAVDVVPARHRELFAWALREGVTNVVRHASATWCGVHLAADCVEIRDDGRGPGGWGGGNGLAGLQARAEKAGARLEIDRAAEGGFLLRVVAGRAAA
jgi:two-component system, NarL family, sensor histidine kinase DesK